MKYNWERVSRLLDNLGYHKKIVIKREEIAHPSRSLGFREAFGEPDMQLRDFRKTINGSECLHVQEYNTHYAVHKDKVDPGLSPIGHLISDAPEIPIAIAATIITGYPAAMSHYEKVKYTSEHPIFESAVVGLSEGGGAGLVAYLLGKLLRESIE